MQRGDIADADATTRPRLHGRAYAAFGHTYHRLNLYHHARHRDRFCDVSTHLMSQCNSTPAPD